MLNHNQCQDSHEFIKFKPLATEEWSTACLMLSLE
ncbi:MAG: hypothetical protein H6Q70_1212 [Firmicutes bacterium]|nr:hypothetical protein [Bacillota bacterium]